MEFAETAFTQADNSYDCLRQEAFMKADIVPLVVGDVVFLSSLVSLKLGISVAIIETNGQGNS